MEGLAKCGCFVSGSIQMCHMHATAPELLEALEAIMLHIRILKSRDPSIFDDVLMAVAEEVIRKAKEE